MRVVAGVEIDMDKGWKTYWRQPGDGGGIPPSFDWSGSMNVRSIEVLYPAPKRFRNFSNFSVGYMGNVIFPVRIVPERQNEPVKLRLSLSIGLCSSICVPALASLSHVIEPNSAPPLPKGLRDALLHVPVNVDDQVVRARAGMPRLKRHNVKLDGDSPRIVMETEKTDERTREDVFTEISGGIFLPMARHRPRLGAGTYVIDLSQVDDISQLKGQTVSVTIVSDTGNSVERFTVK